MRIFGWLADEAGPGIIRIRLPLEELAKRGHDTYSSDYWGGDWINTDVVVGARVSRPEPSVRWRDVHKRSDRPFMVYEVDDDLLNLHPSNPAHEFFSKPDIREHHLKNISIADRMTVSTPRLAEVYGPYNSDIRVVPNAVPDWMFELPSSARTDGRITIGWGGSPNHVMDWEEAGPLLQRFLKRNPNVEMHTIGPRLFVPKGLAKNQWRHTNWIRKVEDYWRALDFHIGVAPLRPHQFNWAKSFLKALEYGARGIPVVASDVGPYSSYVMHGVTGFLVKRDHEWSKYLSLLVEEHQLRENMGQAAREAALQYTLSRTSPLWENALTP